MELFESYGNLDKLDKSFFPNNGLKDLKFVTPESEVYVDKLKKEEGSEVSRHTWRYLTDELLEDKSIAFIIIRSNKRQLLWVCHNSAVNNLSDYVLRWSDLAQRLDYVQENSSNGRYSTSSDVSVRNKICKTVEAFINANPNAKKNWDIIVVKTSSNKINKAVDRRKSREGMELKPNHKEYGEYIRSLKQSLSHRLIAYSESKLKNVLSTNDLNAVLDERVQFVLPKIKIYDTIWNLYTKSANVTSDGKLQCFMTYSCPYSLYGTAYSHLSYIHIKMESQGTKMVVTDMCASRFSNYTMSDDTRISFEDFLINYKNYLDTLPK